MLVFLLLKLVIVILKMVVVVLFQVKLFFWFIFFGLFCLAFSSCLGLCDFFVDLVVIVVEML